MAPSDKSDLLQGTLDLLILKTLSLGPLHGYAIGQRINQVSRARLVVPQGSLCPGPLSLFENRRSLDAVWVDTDAGRQARRSTA